MKVKTVKTQLKQLVFYEMLKKHEQPILTILLVQTPNFPDLY